MPSKKLLTISFLITLAIALIPIQRQTRVSLECPPTNESPCFEKLPSRGFPLAIITTTPFESPVSSIDWKAAETYFGAIPPFIINWSIFFLATTLSWKIFNLEN